MGVLEEAPHVAIFVSVELDPQMRPDFAAV
jgi:hypothetical protein